jgi:hypothetical protein
VFAAHDADTRTDNALCTGVLIASFRRAAARSSMSGASWRAMGAAYETRAAKSGAQVPGALGLGIVLQSARVAANGSKFPWFDYELSFGMAWSEYIVADPEVSVGKP